MKCNSGIQRSDQIVRRSWVSPKSN
ncbi:hypothetical protein VCHC17A1_0260A, partial [Vibrio cholerae HC-17A1]